tara:strand:- start:1436 stop:1684 length:249 start_codon:yes stop_codon:yes gene_type:complete
MKNQYRSMLMGGLLTKGIKAAYKQLRKTSRSKQEIMKDSKVSEDIAKSDVKSGVRDILKSKLKFEKDKIKRRSIIRDLNKLK